MGGLVVRVNLSLGSDSFSDNLCDIHFSYPHYFFLYLFWIATLILSVLPPLFPSSPTFPIPNTGCQKKNEKHSTQLLRRATIIFLSLSAERLSVTLSKQATQSSPGFQMESWSAVQSDLGVYWDIHSWNVWWRRICF